MSTPYMNLPIPTVDQTPGPDWAMEVNSSFTSVDSHNHAAGQGRPINPAGININADLAMNNYNLNNSRSLQLFSNASPLNLGTDIRCLYAASVDLYFNDGNGNQIRITQGGGVAGTPGSIGSLSPPASVTYVSASQKFVFQQGVNQAASLDVGSITIRDLTTSSNGVTISPPNALGSNYDLTLPTLPPGQQIMTLDSLGKYFCALYCR